MAPSGWLSRPTATRGIAGAMRASRRASSADLNSFARLVLAQGEIQEHHLRFDLGQAPAQFFDAGHFLGQQAHVAQRLPELRGDAVALGTK